MYGNVHSHSGLCVGHCSDTLRPLWTSPWPGELEGGSLAIAISLALGHNASPVPALSPTLSGCLRCSATGTVGGAADGRRSMRSTSFGTPVRVARAVFCAGNRTQWETTSRGQNERFVTLLYTCHLYLARTICARSQLGTQQVRKYSFPTSPRFRTRVRAERD